MSQYFVQRSECGRHTLFPGVEAFTMAGDKLMLSWIEMEPHAIVERHSHPHEQLGLLVDGTMTFEIGAETKELQPGDMWRIPGGVPHRVVAGASGARALDVFHPVREEYL
jgi:quercetin dioxygenase-like cupin family protein